MADGMPELTYVEWIDSCGPRGWTQREELMKGYEPDHIRSIGFVVHETDAYLTLAGHWGKQCVDGVICIPKVAIMARKTVKVGRVP